MNKIVAREPATTNVLSKLATSGTVYETHFKKARKVNTLIFEDERGMSYTMSPLNGYMGFIELLTLEDGSYVLSKKANCFHTRLIIIILGIFALLIVSMLYLKTVEQNVQQDMSVAEEKLDAVASVYSEYESIPSEGSEVQMELTDEGTLTFSNNEYMAFQYALSYDGKLVFDSGVLKTDYKLSYTPSENELLILNDLGTITYDVYLKGYVEYNDGEHNTGEWAPLPTGISYQIIVNK